MDVVTLRWSLIDEKRLKTTRSVSERMVGSWRVRRHAAVAMSIGKEAPHRSESRRQGSIRLFWIHPGALHARSSISIKPNHRAAGRPFGGAAVIIDDRSIINPPIINHCTSSVCELWSKCLHSSPCSVSTSGGDAPSASPPASSAMLMSESASTHLGGWGGRRTEGRGDVVGVKRGTH